MPGKQLIGVARFTEHLRREHRLLVHTTCGQLSHGLSDASRDEFEATKNALLLAIESLEHAAPGETWPLGEGEEEE